MSDLHALSARQLLQLYGAVLEELRARDVVRTGNNPVADYAETLCCRAFGWLRETNSRAGYDATDPAAAGVRYQIKGRRITRRNGSRQMSALRRLDQKPFEHLVGVLFAEDFSVARAVVLPHASVLGRATYVSHTNGWRFHLTDDLWSLPEARDVTEPVRAAQAALG